MFLPCNNSGHLSQLVVYAEKKPYIKYAAKKSIAGKQTRRL